MRDYLEIGASPCDEDCVQLDNNDPENNTKQREECKRFIALLKERFTNIPENAWFAVKGFEHDFGRYFEVVVYFDDEDEDSTNFAYFVESNSPLTWNDNTPIDWTKEK